MVENLPAMKETWIQSLGQENLLEKGMATPVFLPGEFHGKRSLAGYSPWGCREPDMTEQLRVSLPTPLLLSSLLHSTNICYIRIICLMMGKALQCNNDWSGCDPPWDNGKGEKEEAVKADVQFNTCCPVRSLWIRREWVVRKKVQGGGGGQQEKLPAWQHSRCIHGQGWVSLEPYLHLKFRNHEKNLS